MHNYRKWYKIFKITVSTFCGIKGFYSFKDSGLPSISFGYESEDPESTASEQGYFISLTWAEVGPRSISLGLSSIQNFIQIPIYGWVTITPGIFTKEVFSADDESGLMLNII